MSDAIGRIIFGTIGFLMAATGAIIFVMFVYAFLKTGQWQSLSLSDLLSWVAIQFFKADPYALYQFFEGWAGLKKILDFIPAIPVLFFGGFWIFIVSFE